MSHRLVSAYAVRLVDVDVSCAEAVPRPRRLVVRFFGVVTNVGISRTGGPRMENETIDRETIERGTAARGTRRPAQLTSGRKHGGLGS